MLIFVSCCYLCCCAKKKEDAAKKEGQVEFSGWSAGGQSNSAVGGYGAASGKQSVKGRQPQGAYIARP